MLGMFTIMGYGWYKLFHGQREKLELAREKMWSRIHITPLLQAEEDRDQVRRWYADQAREQELLGTQTRSIHADKYVTRTKLSNKVLIVLQICAADIWIFARVDERLSLAAVEVKAGGVEVIADL